MSAEPDSSGKIHIEQLELFARIGVPDAERAKPQRLTVNITLWPVCDLGDMSDQIERTVNYSAVCNETKKFVSQTSDKLLETLSHRLARHLLKTFALQRITLELRKFVLPDAQFVSVTVTCSAED